MGDRHDYVALEWVKGEIAETLKQARQALEAYVENPQDSTRMRFCLTYVHQVQGTLQMVEFYGAALLAEEMEQLARALMEGRAPSQGEALEVLMQAILQLPVYLDRIQTARRDLPMVVLPLLNDLRAARGEKLLSETSLFSPDMSGRAQALSSESLAERQTAEWPSLLRKLRQMLQVALVGLIRNQDLPTNLGYMARVFARLETLCQGAPLGTLWPVASAVVEGLADGSVANSGTVRNLLGQADKELKRLLEQGAVGINQAAPDELIKNLLFYVAKAPGRSPRIQALRAQYSLDEALPDNRVVDEERARLAGPDRDAMRSVVGALCEELVRVKDSLDLFVRSDRARVGELETLLAPLKQIADTLAVLGFGQPRKVIVDQVGVVQALARGQREPDDAVLMDVAGALLYVEATLAGMVGPAEERDREESLLPTTDVAQIHQVVIKEARNGLEQAKDAIIEFIASQWNHEHLARAPELLTQVRGGLAMIPLARAANLLEACNRYIREQLLERKAVPDWQSLDTLADAITSVEYYLERLSEDHASQGDLILDVAEDSLASLGYALKEKPAGFDLPEPVFEPGPPPVDPLDEIEVLAADEALSLDDLPWPEEDGAGVEAPAPESPDASSAALGELAAFDLTPPAEPTRGEAPPAFELYEEPDILPDDSLHDGLLPDDPAQWDEEALAALQLPEVELPLPPTEAPDELAATLDEELSLADVMAAPLQAINPPARDVPPSLLPPPDDEEPVDEDLRDVFIEEAGEVLEAIAHYLPRWQADSDDHDALIEVRRAFHTLKGSGRMVRALVIGELAWSIENLLNRVLDRSIQPDANVRQVVGDVVGLVPELVEEYAAKAQRQRDDVDHLAATAHALARGQAMPGPVVSVPLAVEAGVPQADTREVLDPQLLEIFRNEAETHLDTLVGFLADCAQELPQPVTDDLQRALHTLKGSASMAGIVPVAEIAAPLEKLVKEFKTNLIALDLAEAELLSTAEHLFRAGLAQLETHPLAPLPEAGAFLERVQKLHQERLEAAEARIGQNGEARDPQLIGIFLAEGMDILLDAEQLLRRWREHPSERQELSALLEELTTLGRGAEMAELPQIDELCEALLDLYGAVEEGSLAVSERFFSEAALAHEALIDMMDQLAAGLQVSARPERVAALRELLGEALDPATLALLSADGVGGLDIVELDAATAELEQGLFEQRPGDRAVPLEEAGSGLDEEMVSIFLEEAVDILESAGSALERWLAEPDNRAALSSLQRDLHTLKGGARMAQIRPIGDLAHELEALYEGLTDRRYGHSAKLAGLLQQSHDRLAALLDQLQQRIPLDRPDDLIEALHTFRQAAGSGLDDALPATAAAEALDATSAP